MKLSIIIPVYNEEQTVTEVINRVRKVNLGKKIAKEIIVVDDGSTDKSQQLIRQYRRQFPELKTYLSIINLGKGAAIRFGIKHATGDIILIQDADLELDPNEYSRLITPIIQKKASIVYGSRFLRPSPNIPATTKFVNWCLTLLTNLLYGTRLTDMETAYKAFKADVVRNLRLRCVEFDFEPEFTAKVSQLGYIVHEVPISYTPRRINEGKKISTKDGLDAVSTLIKNKLFPKPTRINGLSLFPSLINYFTFPLRVIFGQDTLEKLGLLSLATERVVNVLPYVKDRLLDIGAGENKLVKSWRQAGGKGIGVDVYPWPGLDKVCDTTKLPFKDESFDTVSFLACLNHIPKRKQVLAEAYRVTKPGGRLIITMINKRIGFVCHKLIWWDKDQHQRGMVKGEHFGLDNHAVRQLITKAGYTLDIEKRFSFLGLNTLYVATKNP